MKKYVISLLLAAVAMVSGWALAQRHDYIKEDFSTPKPIYVDTMKWDMAATGALNRQTLELMYFSGSKNAGGVAPEAVFGYAPSSGLSTVIDTTLRLLSKPFATQENARNYVTFKYSYQGSKASAATARSFGIALRKGTGDWTVCTQIPSFPATPDEAVGGRLVAEVPAAFANASDVQLSVFHKSSKDNIQYLLFFDDIEAFAFDNNYYAASYAWEGEPYTGNGVLNVNLLMENIGNTMDSCVLSYTFNDGEVKTMPIKFGKSLMPGEVYTKLKFSPEGWDATAYARHKIEFWISKADNYEVPADKVVKQTKYLTNIDPSVPAYTFRPLMEHFTSSTCGPCATINGYMNAVYESLKDTMTLVKYQMNWPGNGDPYYTAEGGVRLKYYGVGSVPEAYLNGVKTRAIESAAAAKAAILKNAGGKVYYDLLIDTAAVDVNQHIHLTIKAKSVPGMDKVRLHTVVMENVTTKNVGSNGEKEFHHVMMKMLPNAEGELVDMKPDTTYTFTYVYDMTKTNMEEVTDLKVACFLQGESGMVYQSAIREVGCYSKGTGLYAEVNYMPTYVGGTDVPVGLKLTGMGGVTATEVEVTGKFGASGTPVTHTYTTNLAWGQSTYVAFADLKAGSQSDTAYFQVTKVNGEAYEGAVVRRFVNVSATDYAFKPIVEGFVSSIATGNKDLHAYLDGIDAADAIVAKFPLKGDRYTRTSYTKYADKIGAAAPAISLNGCLMPGLSSTAPAHKLYIDNLVAQSKKLNSVLSVAQEGDVTIGADGSLNVSGKLNLASPIKMQCRVYLFVVESVTQNNTNPASEQKRIVQALFPDENGTSQNIVNGTGMMIINRMITTSKVENYANLSLVVVVKDAAGQDVLQSAEFPIINKGVANEGLAACETLEVYPNPASEFVYLKGLQNAYVEVSDMNGVKVFGQNNVNGDYTLNVQGYTPGLYVIKVREGAKTSVAKISVVK